MEFFGEKVMPAIVLLLVLCLCLLVGIIAEEIGLPGGPDSVLVWGLSAALLMGALCAYFGSLLFDLADFGKPSSGAVVVGLLAAAAALAAPMNTVVYGRQQAISHQEMAPKVQAFALAYFESIDLDKNGIIVESELEQARRSLLLSPAEQGLLVYMQEQLCEMGHVIDSTSSTFTSFITVGNISVPQIQTITHNIYGLNRNDLAEFPSRIREKYKNW